jgi:endonuclease/exonuclease/phosphatase (EEP) superfamily protein YafD
MTARRIHTPDGGSGVAIASLAPWATPVYAGLVVAAVAVWRHTRVTATVLAVVGLVGLGLEATWQLPFYVGSRTHLAADLTVMESNLHFGQADPARVLSLARSAGAEVLVLTEVTPQERSRLAAQGLGALYPFHAGHPAEEVRGTMVFSSYALTTLRTLGMSRGGYVVRVHSTRPFTLVIAHAGQPFFSGDAWALDLRRLTTTVAALRGPRMLVGDLNASMDTTELRALCRAGGLTDAARDARSGWQPTWPGDIGIWPLTDTGAAAIDHVLVSSAFHAVRTQTHKVPHTDHRALIAWLAQ